jgi:hypothetical protein
MENQTHYDLNAAIESWRHELATQANLTMDVRRELETHLRDAIAGYQQRGLNDEESFWLARRRVGQPQQLDEEFVKANPAAVWRKRILWMAAAVLVVSLWTVSSGIIYRTFMSSPNLLSNPLVRSQRFWQTFSFQITFSFLLRTSPLIILVIFLLRGTGRIFSLLESLIQSRSRFVFMALGWLAVNEGLLAFHWLADLKHHNPGNGPIISIWANLIPTVIWPLALVFLVAWLMTPQDRKSPKHA